MIAYALFCTHIMGLSQCNFTYLHVYVLYFVTAAIWHNESMMPTILMF